MDSGSAVHLGLRSGVALAMHHRLCDISICVLNGLRRGDEQPAYTTVKCMAPFTFLGCITALARGALLLQME